MSDPKSIQNNVSELLDTLKIQVRQIKETAAKPEVAAWFAVDLKKYLVELKALGLPVKEISSSRITCQKESKNLLSKTFDLTNACGDLQADIIGGLDKKQASIRAEKIVKQHELIASEVDSFFSHAIFLAKTGQQLNQQLTIQNLLKVAACYAGKKKGAFQKGLDLFTFFFHLFWNSYFWSLIF